MVLVKPVRELQRLKFHILENHIIVLITTIICCHLPFAVRFLLYRTMEKKCLMAKHNAITTSPVTSPTSPHLTSRYPTDDEEEPNEMVVVFIVWDAAAVNRFLEKWDNANFAESPPFDRPNNSQDLHRQLLAHLTRNLTGASVRNVNSVDCNALASMRLTAAMARLDREQWVRNIIDAQPVGWNSTIGALNVAYGGKTEHVRFGDNLMFE